MKKIFLLILSLLISSSVFAQKFYLKDKLTNEEVEYAHIAFSNNGKGIYSDEIGFFELKAVTDSIYITHIGFRDTIISTRNLPTIIYLTTSENQLKSIEVSSTRQAKRFTFRKETKTSFNVCAIEIGTTFSKKDNEKWNFIREIRIPIKLGKDVPIIRVNVYEFDFETMKPTLPIWSLLVKEENYKKNEIVLEGLFLDLEDKEALFISLDIVSYNINDINAPIHIPPYSNSNDAIEIWLRKREESYAMIRNRRVNSGWVVFPFSSLQKSDKEPIIHLEIE